MVRARADLADGPGAECGAGRQRRRRVRAGAPRGRAAGGEGIARTGRGQPAVRRQRATAAVAPSAAHHTAPDRTTLHHHVPGDPGQRRGLPSPRVPGRRARRPRPRSPAAGRRRVPGRGRLAAPTGRNGAAEAASTLVVAPRSRGRRQRRQARRPGTAVEQRIAGQVQVRGSARHGSPRSRRPGRAAGWRPGRRPSCVRPAEARTTTLPVAAPGVHAHRAAHAGRGELGDRARPASSSPTAAIRVTVEPDGLPGGWPWASQAAVFAA